MPFASTTSRKLSYRFDISMELSCFPNISGVNLPGLKERLDGRQGWLLEILHFRR